jgi:hypothetical protein
MGGWICLSRVGLWLREVDLMGEMVYLFVDDIGM